MCGIAGIFELNQRPVEESLVERMCESLEHRGPDAGGLVHPEVDIVLGHRRLSIIDVDGGSQPMCNEDGTVWITFNGEIFNFKELREELSSKGHIFRSRSDTEVVVHLYEEMGPSCVERLNGQFAFAIYDGNLFCARDPIGIKPFYYYFDGARFAFSSEPRAFFALPDSDMTIDHEALILYMKYQYIPSPYSSYRKVRKLRPGEQLLVSRNQDIKHHRYGALTTTIDEPLEDMDSSRRILTEAFSSAVKRQMVADFPVGAFLSGGIDSSSVLAMAQTHSEIPLKSFTIGFPEKDERVFAKEVTEYVGSESIQSEFGHLAALPAIIDLLDHIDEPLGDTSLLPTYAVSKLAREHTPVALSGDGGDELFAGYGRYARAMRYLSANRVSRSIWDIASLLPSSSLRIEDWDRLDSHSCKKWPERISREMSDSHGSHLYGPALREADLNVTTDPIFEEIYRHRDLPPLTQLLAVDLQTSLSDRLLAKVDRASMKSSLEVRVPFLDLDLLRCGLRLSPTVRLHEGQQKGALKAVMGGLLPTNVFERNKEGFGAPMKYWFARDLSSYVRDHLDNSIAVQEGFVSRKGLSRLLKPRRSQKVNGPRVWRILVLEKWLRSIKEGRFKTSNDGHARLRRFTKISSGFE